jgi:hypothetical protein
VAEDRNRSEDFYTRDCVGDLFVIGDGIGGNDWRCAADRRSGRNERRELGLAPEQLPNPDGKAQGGEQCRRDNADPAAADLDPLA